MVNGYTGYNISIFCMGGAILTGRNIFYFYEELRWWFIYSINTIISIYLYTTVKNFNDKELLIQLNIIIGFLYLLWQIIHLKSLWIKRKITSNKNNTKDNFTVNLILNGLNQSIYKMKKTTRTVDWGGIIGITWMTCYWATLIPFWIYLIIQKF